MNLEERQRKVDSWQASSHVKEEQVVGRVICTREFESRTGRQLNLKLEGVSKRISGEKVTWLGYVDNQVN